MKYPHLAARLFNTPLLVHPGKLDAIIAGLGGRLLGSSVHLDAMADNAGLAPEMFSTRRGERGDAGYAITDGVAVIHASGALVHRSRMDGLSSYLLGYNELASQVEAAQADVGWDAYQFLFGVFLDGGANFFDGAFNFVFGQLGLVVRVTTKRIKFGRNRIARHGLCSDGAGSATACLNIAVLPAHNHNREVICVRAATDVSLAEQRRYCLHQIF